MNERPEVSRISGKLELSSEAERVFVALAKKHGEDPTNVLAELRRGLPLARLFLKSAGYQLPEVRNGRSPDNVRLAAICKAVDDLRWSGCSKAEAIRLAPAKLQKQDICGPEGRPLTQKAIREAVEKWPRLWHVPIEDSKIEI